jgi:transcription elongation factor Elf1
MDEVIVLGTCGFCGSEAKVKCSRCKSTFYCDRNCQKRDWKIHKIACGQVQQSTDVKIVEPLDAVDVSNLELKVELREKGAGKIGVFTTSPVTVSN